MSNSSMVYDISLVMSTYDLLRKWYPDECRTWIKIFYDHSNNPFSGDELRSELAKVKWGFSRRIREEGIVDSVIGSHNLLSDIETFFCYQEKIPINGWVPIINEGSK